MDGQIDVLSTALLSTMGRIAFKPLELFAIVDPTGKAPKNVQAYNLADGTKTQGEIVGRLKLDKGNFSGVVNKWIEAGVLFRIGEGKNAKLLHLYSLPSSRPKE